MGNFNSVSENLKKVGENIEKSAQRIGRTELIKIVAVTKKIPVDRIREAVEAGHRLFGENYVQEAEKKIEQLKDVEGLDWHFIGGLQTNKAKRCLSKFSMIQTVDRENLALVLDKEATKRNIKDYPVLAEVNLGGEETKSGVLPSKLLDLIRKISQLEGIKVKGLMTMPPYCEDPENSRKYFIQLRELKEKILSQRIASVEMNELSMGMSHDYFIAVEEGATIVRIGTAIFGSRN